MSSGLSIDERLHIIREVFLVIGRNDTITSASGPQMDSFFLVRAILEDGRYACTGKQRLIAVLKKSPVWSKLRPFVENGDKSCGRRGCQCPEFYHRNGACSGTHYKRTGSSWLQTQCTCPAFIKKDFK